MVLKGYCITQNRQFSIDVDEIPCPTFENPKATIYGRINCQYVSCGGKCDGNCSILKQNGRKQG